MIAAAPAPEGTTMTTTSALVLGGGGPVGIAWEAGLLTGLARHGADPARADLVLGTSAGSVVGATLTSGGDLAALPHRMGGPPADAPAAAPDLAPLMAIMADTGADPDTTVRRVIDFALTASTGAEADWVGLPLFASFADVPWPTAFACTVIDTESAMVRTLSIADGVPLPSALAASCAVPGMFPPVTIDGVRYVDGGMRSGTNHALAAGHQHVVVVSCFPLDAPSPGARQGLADLADLRSAGSEVLVIEPGPEFTGISENGAALMDGSRTGAAYEAGVRQGDAELAERVAAAGLGRGSARPA
jgi:NTE family protein